MKSEQFRSRKSAVALVAANVAPLLGVLFFGWRAFDVVIVYWLENVLIGALNVLRMITCVPDEDAIARSIESLPQKPGVSEEALAMQASKFFLAPFFTVHYGMFCFVHGVFVCVLLGGGAVAGPLEAGPAAFVGDVFDHSGVVISTALLAVSHVYSYFANFLRGGEYRRVTPLELMTRPYARVVVLHVAILGSGFLTVLFGSPIWMLVLLVIGKTWLDLRLHRREHAKGPADLGVFTTA